MDTHVVSLDGSTQVAGAFKVDPSRGKNIGLVSSQWFSRPADQRFDSLEALVAYVRRRSTISSQQVIDASDIRVHVNGRNPEHLALIHDGIEDGVELNATHWSFGQVASLAQVPAGYLRQLQGTPGGNSVAGINLQFGLNAVRAGNVKALVNTETHELRALTSPEYGRIFDHEVVEAVQRLVDRTGGIFKIPGTLDWATNLYDPHNISSTTLYASDRDCFMFLVDDTHPIEIGKLADGSPDLVFRGFIVWNSETGSRTFGLMTFLLRAVCMNRNIWGAQDVSELIIRHSKNAPLRFAAEAAPRLIEYANQSSLPIINGMRAAKATVVARDDDDRQTFLKQQGFSKRVSQSILDGVVEADGKPAESIFDFVQGITAYAKGIEHQDERVDLERKAGKLLDRAAKRAA
jgi:hypothetical protein